MFDTGFYIMIFLIGIVWSMIREVFDFDFTGSSGLGTAISTFLLIWGFLGFMGAEEPIGVLIATGFAVLMVLIVASLMVSIDIERDYVGLIGSVNMRIDHDGIGKIVVKTNKGDEFFQARPSEKISKPIQIGSQVKIDHFRDLVAYVHETKETDTAPVTTLQYRHSIFRRLFSAIKYRNSRNQQKCRICYGSILHLNELEKCGNCKATFHKDHIANWLRDNTTCPQCHARLI